TRAFRQRRMISPSDGSRPRCKPRRVPGSGTTHRSWRRSRNGSFSSKVPEHASDRITSAGGTAGRATPTHSAWTIGGGPRRSSSTTSSVGCSSRGRRGPAVLDPRGRQLLLSSLRPPEGFRFDCAVGTTFSLDLVALLTTPLAFAMFDWQDDQGRLAADPS